MLRMFLDRFTASILYFRHKEVATKFSYGVLFQKQNLVFNGCAKNPAKRFLVVAVFMYKRSGFRLRLFETRARRKNRQRLI
jgi:hypothetical protein